MQVDVEDASHDLPVELQPSDCFSEPAEDSDALVLRLIKLSGLQERVQQGSEQRAKQGMESGTELSSAGIVERQQYSSPVSY